jgi:hypothetical protein
VGGGQGGEMTQALYAHMNNEIKEREKKKVESWFILKDAFCLIAKYLLVSMVPSSHQNNYYITYKFTVKP